jgi:hypothetical protein
LTGVVLSSRSGYNIYWLKRKGQYVLSLLDGKTPFEAFTDEFHPGQDNRPSVAHFRVLGCKTYVQIPKERRTTGEKVQERAEVGILVGYEGSHIFKVYILTRRGPLENRIVQSSNVRFDEGGLITKPHSIDEADISLPIGNRGDQENQDRQDSDLIHPRVPNMPQNIKDIDRLEDIDQAETDSDIEQGNESDKDQDDIVPMPEVEPEPMQEVESKPRSKGRPKGSRNKVYIPNPEFGRETQQQTRTKLNLEANSALSAFYTTLAAGPESSIYDEPETTEEAKKGPNWPE